MDMLFFSSSFLVTLRKKFIGSKQQFVFFLLHDGEFDFSQKCCIPSQKLFFLITNLFALPNSIKQRSRTRRSRWQRLRTFFFFMESIPQPLHQEDSRSR